MSVGACACMFRGDEIGQARKGLSGSALSETYETVRPTLFSSELFPVKQGDDYLTARGKQGYYISFEENVDLWQMEWFFFLNQQPNNGRVHSVS